MLLTCGQIVFRSCPQHIKRLSRPGLETKEKSGTAPKFPKSIALSHFFHALYLRVFHDSQNKQELFFYAVWRDPSLQRAQVCFLPGRKRKLKYYKW